MSISHALDFQQLMADLHDDIERRSLLVMGTDALGNVLPWIDPALVDIRIAPRDRSHFYRLPAMLKPLIHKQGIPVIDPELLEQIAEQAKEEIIAQGRRFAMKGDL